MLHTHSNFTDAYIDIINEVYNAPEYECAPRGKKIKECLGLQFKITNPRDRLLYVPERKWSLSYFIAESLWYLSANDSTDWIANYSSFWKNISDDGLTANSAYGARIFAPHPRIAGGINTKWCQWEYVINELVADNDSRRAIIHIRSPQDSLLAQKDVPCTLTLQFFLRNDNVHMIVSMRSSDIILGIAYDVPAFTLFQEMLAEELTVRLGRSIGLGDYIHMSASMHIYERHFEMCKKILEGTMRHQGHENAMPMLPSANIPVKSLIKFETDCRNSRDSNSLTNVVLAMNLNQQCTNDSNDYWIDWARILAAHRAQKLGNNELMSEILSTISYNGYKMLYSCETK